MLFDPARHESLDPAAWDAARAQATIARIVDDTRAAFTPEWLWPSHPLDLESDGGVAPALTPLYFGAAGVVWALHYLDALGVIQAPATQTAWLDHIEPIRVHNQAWLARVGIHADASYLIGELPMLMLRHAQAPTPALEARLAGLIAGNIDHPARELMWGAPGTLLAACFLFEQTQNERWAALFRETAAHLWSQLQWSDEHACHFWTQDLYGQRSTYLDGVHGFVATASPLIRGRHLLDAAHWSRWQEAIANTVRKTATWEDGKVNWRAQLDSKPASNDGLLMQFCHGAPGFVTCLARFPDATLDDLLIAAGAAIWEAGPLVKGASLCHGTAGNGYAFLALYGRTRDPIWLERARAFAMQGMRQCEAHAAQYGRLRYSLWTGDPGLAIYLADCLRGEAAFPTLDVFYPPRAS
ncbi:Lanthionine synthetase C-like protein [Paraburkholderia unamae]|uniref:lanthionine synthetase C family protein n=1 Tax=Paraburkholderia unamae TaxID=219649 RepID=UPI001CB4DB8F|nr:LanC-like protein [Paraburkholderia unamae]CAG9274792.1 Lanthionine synthetase C-like protein [Paraburkholderia unamae]